MEKPLRKMMKILSPKRMYIFNMAGVFLNLSFALIGILIDLPSANVEIFLASGLCFFIGGLVNRFMTEVNTSKK